MYASGCTIYQWRRPGAEFGGDGKISRGPRFLNDVFFGKNVHFHGQNFFLVIDQVFRIFSFFSHIIRIFTMFNVVLSYMTLSSQKNTTSEKNSFITSFFTLFVLSRASDNTASQNIRGTDEWAVPPPQILGDRPPRS